MYVMKDWLTMLPGIPYVHSAARSFRDGRANRAAREGKSEAVTSFRMAGRRLAGSGVTSCQCSYAFCAWLATWQERSNRFQGLEHRPVLFWAWFASSALGLTSHHRLTQSNENEMLAWCHLQIYRTSDIVQFFHLLFLFLLCYVRWHRVLLYKFSEEMELCSYTVHHVSQRES